MGESGAGGERITIDHEAKHFRQDNRPSEEKPSENRKGHKFLLIACPHHYDTRFTFPSESFSNSPFTVSPGGGISSHSPSPTPKRKRDGVLSSRPV